MKIFKLLLMFVLAHNLVACGGGSNGGGEVDLNFGEENTPETETEPDGESEGEPEGESEGEPEGEVTDATADAGFAGHNFNLTGGEGGTAYTVNNGKDLQTVLDNAKSSNSPVIIYVDGTINSFNSANGNQPIQIKDMDNVSIIGYGAEATFDGVGIAIRRANNIIIRNLTFKSVLTEGKDAISIEGDDDGSTTSNIWVDHNEFYSAPTTDKDFYDGLIDSKSGASNITISYNYLHDHWKASLHGHTENDEGAHNTDRKITFHHNRFENIESRLPLFRRGVGHLYNNYYKDIGSTAINSRIGAELLIENNVFEDSQNPIVSFYSDVIGYWNTSGNLFTNVTWTTPGTGEVSAGATQTPTSDYVVPYSYTLMPAADVKAHVIANAGVGKIDQTGLTIPDPVTPEGDLGEPEAPVQGDVSLPYTENFAATDAANFFSAAYRDITGSAGTSTPMYHRVTGTVEINAQQLDMTGARVSIGNTTPSVSTTGADTTTTGVLDLSAPYTVSFKVVSVGGTLTKKFQIYVDNNTSASGDSIHGGSSRFYSETLDSLVAGQTYTVTGFTATNSSFITLRTESSAQIVLDDLSIQAAE